MGLNTVKVLLLSFLFYSGTTGEEADDKSSLDSILKSRVMSWMNGTVAGMDGAIAGLVESMGVIEEKVLNVEGTIAGIANKLEAIQIAQAEWDRRRKLEEREILNRILLNPRAKLYSGLNYIGDLESYDFNAPTYKGGCYNLAKLNGTIQSVNTEGSCVRIFKRHNCIDWSQALYPGSSATIDAKLGGVGSVGPCVSNEFEYVTLTMSGNPPVPTVHKRAEEVAVFANVPDLVPDFWTMSISHSLNNADPITHYKLGQEGRLEGLRAEIYPRHILTPDVTRGNRLAGLNQSFFPDLGMIPLTDEPGYVVPLELGGPAKEAYNTFAQDKGQEAKYRAFLVPMIKELLPKYPTDYVIFAAALQYGDSVGKRPDGIWYRTAAGPASDNEVTYGYFPNEVLALHGEQISAPA